jgi:hypothetical protein
LSHVLSQNKPVASITEAIEKGKSRQTFAEMNRPSASAIHALREFLAALPAGPISETRQLEYLLAESWSSLHGARRAGMDGYKIVGRAESMCWNPPSLTFTIERHGGTVMGSTRAELQDWCIDVSSATAEIVKTRRRQIRSTAKRVVVAGLAEQIAEAILSGREHEALKRYPDGRVRVLISTVIPDDGFKQTISGRRKRFRKTLETKLAEHGWESVSMNSYKRKVAEDVAQG